LALEAGTRLGPYDIVALLGKTFIVNTTREGQSAPVHMIVNWDAALAK
jgi:hypothetical protein